MPVDDGHDLPARRVLTVRNGFPIDVRPLNPQVWLAFSAKSYSVFAVNSRCSCLLNSPLAGEANPEWILFTKPSRPAKMGARQVKRACGAARSVAGG